MLQCVTLSDFFVRTLCLDVRGCLPKCHLDWELSHNLMLDFHVYEGRSNLYFVILFHFLYKKNFMGIFFLIFRIKSCLPIKSNVVQSCSTVSVFQIYRT